MSEKQGKWEFLRPYVKRSKLDNPKWTNQDIAYVIIDEFHLDLDPDTVRKIVSRIVNSEEVEENTESKIEDRRIERVFEKITTPQTAIKTGAKVGNHFKWNKPGVYLILPCVHAPFHNRQLLSGIVDLMGDVAFDGLILDGDFLDCNSLSGHDRGKFTAIPGLNLTEEYRIGRTLLTHLTDNLPATSLRAYLYGNHEDRYWRFIADMQNSKTPPMSPTEGLTLNELGFITIESYSAGYMTLGNHLDVLHGVYYNTHSAKTHIDRFRGSVLYAHTHRIQSYVEGNTGGFNIGWLGDKNHKAFNYADRGTKAGWQNGFSTVTIDEAGDYYVQQVFCNNNKFYYNNKLYN